MAGAASIAALSLALAPAALAGTPARTARRIGATPAAQRMRLELPLVADTAGLDRFAAAVSTPGNPLYGHYEPVTELAQRFGADPTVRRRALTFLRRHGASHVNVNGTGLFADARMSAGTAERMFAAPLAQFRTGRGTRTFTAPTQAVRIPKALRHVVTGVIGLDTKPFAPQPAADVNPSGYQNASGTPSGCSAGLAVNGFSPNEYVDAYGLNTLQSEGILGQGERLAVIEIDGYRESDLDQFARCFGLHVPHIQPFSVDLPAPLAPGGETELDLEVLMSAAPALSDIDVYESQSEGNIFLLTLAEPLTAKGLTPSVMSASIGICEPDLEQTVGKAGVKTGNAVLAEATATGISVLASSGDAGTAACVGKNGPVDKLAANYPATSKWVTAVGGTNLQLNSDNTISAQQVWNEQGALTDPNTGKVVISAGGGGLSQLFPRPKYQNGTVTQNQRAVPDVALLADGIPGYDIYCSADPGCIQKGESPWVPIGGTSAASPLLAGGFALIDEYLHAHGRQPLGLANPLLYSIGRNPALDPAIFDDVTDGTNDVGALFQGGSAFGCCDAGPGFDEASGWGGVNVANLASVALGLAPKIVKISLALNPKQHAVAKGAIFARVKCSAACRAQAVAAVKVGKHKPFTAASATAHIKGAAILKIGFTPAQRRVLAQARAHREPVTAKVTGSILDAHGDALTSTATKSLAIVP